MFVIIKNILSFILKLCARSLNTMFYEYFSLLTNKKIKIMNQTKKKISDLANDKNVLKSDLLSHVLGGLVDGPRCSAAGSKYNDSVYVKPPPRQL
jgi:hypothetical protein